MAVEWTVHTMPRILTLFSCLYLSTIPTWPMGSFHTSPHVQFLKALITDLQVLSITSLKFHLFYIHQLTSLLSDDFLPIFVYTRKIYNADDSMTSSMFQQRDPLMVLKKMDCRTKIKTQTLYVSTTSNVSTTSTISYEYIASLQVCTFNKDIL